MGKINRKSLFFSVIFILLLSFQNCGRSSFSTISDSSHFIAQISDPVPLSDDSAEVDVIISSKLEYDLTKGSEFTIKPTHVPLEFPEYYWFKNNKPIFGENKPSLFFQNLSVDDSGEYSLLIKGQFSLGDTKKEIEVRKAVAVVRVFEKAAAIVPQIISEPSLDQSFHKGETLILSIKVVGTDLKFQWYKDEKIFEDKKEPELILTDLTKTDAGGYRLVATNSVGTVSTQTIRLNYVALPEEDLPDNNETNPVPGDACLVSNAKSAFWYENFCRVNLCIDGFTRSPDRKSCLPSEVSCSVPNSIMNSGKKLYDQSSGKYSSLCVQFKCKNGFEPSGQACRKICPKGQAAGPDNICRYGCSLDPSMANGCPNFICKYKCPNTSIINVKFTRCERLPRSIKTLSIAPRNATFSGPECMTFGQIID